MITDFDRVLRIIPSCTTAHGVALPDETFEVTSRVSVTLKQFHVAMILGDTIIRFFNSTYISSINSRQFHVAVLLK